MTDASAPGADPVVALIAGGRADPRALYYLWEQQQWEAGRIDLAGDAEQWADLDPGLRRPVADSIAWRRLRAATATHALVPFVDAAPSEEQQVFLTTQLVDEARHLVFFDRVHTEVMGIEGSEMEDRDGVVDDRSLGALLVHVLPDLAGRLREDATDPGRLVSAVTSYHVAIVGALGLTEQGALLGHLALDDVLPGVRKGLELEGRAGARHVAFGLDLIARSLALRPCLGSVLEAELERSLPLVRSALTSLAASAPMPYSAEDLIEGADASLERWFSEAKLDVPVRS